jgi:hypothetical protein
MEFRKTAVAEGGWKIEVVENDVEVSRLYVWDMKIRVAEAQVRFGGIGGVETPYEHRMKGYGRLLLEETVRFMVDEHMPMSFLFGIPGFYHKYGFAPALVGCETSIATRDAETAPRRFVARPYRKEDAPSLAVIYEKQNANRTGTVPRNPATWKGIRMVPWWNDRVRVFVVEDQGAVVGYAAYDYSLDDLTVGEVGYDSPAVFSTLLGQLAAVALERRVETIKIYAPFDEPFIGWSRRFGSTTKINYPRWGAGMGRIIDQEELFMAIKPVLERRIMAHPALASKSLLIRTELAESQLVFGKGSRDGRVYLPQAILTQLVMGYRSVSDALFESEVKADAGSLAMLEALFPAGYPEMWNSDNF